MSVLLIGNRGYIGAFLFEQLILPPSLKLSGCDIKDGMEHKGQNAAGVETADVVIYLAGLSGRKQCLGKPSTHVFDENVVDIMKVADRMKEGALLVYASTASLYEGYGETEADESSALYTHLYDEYTYSMYLREQNIRTLSHIRTLGLRFGTVIGLSPTQRTDLVHLALMRSAVLTGVATVSGATQNRAILWNHDLLQVFQQIIRNRDHIKGNNIYNAGSFCCSVAKIANEIGCQTGCNVLYQPETTAITSIGFSMSSKKIERELGIQWKGTNKVIIDDLKTDLKRICHSPDYLVPVPESTCRVCKQHSMSRVIDFGNQPNANHYVSRPEDALPEYPLTLDRCGRCFHTQLGYTIPPENMFSDYIYLSGTSATLRQYFSDFADKSIAEYGSDKPGVVLEIACNDGSLLDEYAKRGWKTFGFDAAKNIYEISSKKGHEITVGFWGVDPAPEYPPLDLIVAQNVCAHVPDPVVFLEKCRSVMSDNTVLYIQTSQCNMVESGQFDTIYHEHLSFFTIHSMWTAATMAGLAIDQVEKTDIHGISYVFRMRLSSTLDIASHPLYIHERRVGLYSDLMYYVYVEKIRGLRQWILREVDQMREQGITLVGYGAAAKGMTILNYIGSIPLEYIVDDSPKKWGYYATNHKYAIMTPEILTEEDEKLAVIVFAWNFLAEIQRKIAAYRKGKETYLIVPYPKKAIYRIDKTGSVYKVYEEVDTRYNADSLHHKTLLFTHFFNEEGLLTQWIRHHAPLFDSAVLIDHNSTDNSRKVIAREAPASWNVVSTTLPNFCAQMTDNEVAGYENSFDNTDWRLALTTTEFLYTLGLRRKENRELDKTDTKALCIQSLSLIDNAPEQRTNWSASILRQKYSFYFEQENAFEDKAGRLNSHYNRFMHCIRDFQNPYWLGRHSFRHPSTKSSMHIFKLLFSPFPEFYSRKLQIRAKIPEHNVKEGWGFQHLTDMDKLAETYDSRKQLPLLETTNVEGNLEYYNAHIRPITSDQMLLSGIHKNLFGGKVDY